MLDLENNLGLQLIEKPVAAVCCFVTASVTISTSPFATFVKNAMAFL